MKRFPAGAEPQPRLVIEKIKKQIVLDVLHFAPSSLPSRRPRRAKLPSR